MKYQKTTKHIWIWSNRYNRRREQAFKPKRITESSKRMACTRRGRDPRNSLRQSTTISSLKTKALMNPWFWLITSIKSSLDRTNSLMVPPWCNPRKRIRKTKWFRTTDDSVCAQVDWSCVSNELTCCRWLAMNRVWDLSIFWPSDVLVGSFDESLLFLWRWMMHFINDISVILCFRPNLTL